MKKRLFAAFLAAALLCPPAVIRSGETPHANPSIEPGREHPVPRRFRRFPPGFPYSEDVAKADEAHKIIFRGRIYYNYELLTEKSGKPSPEYSAPEDPQLDTRQAQIFSVFFPFDRQVSIHSHPRYFKKHEYDILYYRKVRYE